MSKLFTDLLIATVVTAGLYAVYAAADSTASAMAASFTREEIATHTRTIRFAHAAKRASMEREEARAKCLALPREKRDACHSAGEAEGRRAFETVRRSWQEL